jgi:hypothetical protein
VVAERAGTGDIAVETKDKDDVDDIRRRMLEIRTGLASEVKEIRHHARRLADWHYYLGRFPWASLAAAAVAGYLVIPKRPRVVQADADTLAKLARHNHLVVQTVKDDRAKKSMGGALSAAALGLLAQVGKSYATGQIQKFFKHDVPAHASKSADSTGDFR